MIQDAKKCRVCGEILTLINTSPSFIKRGFTICRSCNAANTRALYASHRIDILNRLGGKCECCSINNLDLLSIDHLHGNGHKESLKNRGRSYINKLYLMPVEQLKSKYRALCFNCNYTRGFWDCCPHELPEGINFELPVSDRGIKQINLSKEEHKNRELILSKIAKIKIRLEAMQAYGGKCSNCEENHPLFMTIDHVNNNGYLEHKTPGIEFYQYLKSFGYPGKGTQVQILCHNCNALKEYKEKRNLKAQQKGLEKEIYIKQDYSISPDEEKALIEKARYLYAQIQTKLKST